MPADLPGQEEGLLEEFLLVVFAEMEVVVGGDVKGEDVVGGLELGDGDETDGGARGGGFGGLDAREDGGDGCGEVFRSGWVDSHFCGFGVFCVGHDIIESWSS